MSIPSIYINLEDDVSKIVTRLKHQTSQQIVLVCPKRCFLFTDSINLRLLKKQVDLLGKEVFILTMDERGQAFASEAGFKLKFLPKSPAARVFSDINVQKPQPTKSNLSQNTEIESEDHELEIETALNAAALQAEQQISRKFAPTAVPKVASEPKFDSIVTQKPEQQIVRAPVEVTDNIFPLETDEKLADKPEKSHSQKIITGLVALTLILILLLVFVILPKATVVVYPKTEPVTRDMEISLSANAKAPDIDKLVLPAEKIDETVNVSDKFQSQGKTQVGNKADGTIKIYNFTKLPINLKAATTILVVGSKNYNLVNDVVGLRPTTYINARTKEVDPASLGDSVEVTATQGGDDYNLPAGTRMEITNQVFGSKPQLLYAKTDTEIAGGTTRYLSVISQDDYTSAEKQLEGEALAQVRQKLSDEGRVLTDGAYSLTASPFSADSAVGSQTPAFTGKLQVQITGLDFNNDDLKNLIFQRISQTLASNKTLQVKQPDQTSYKAINLDMNTQLATLNAHFEGQAVFNLDLANIAPQLTGKSQNQVNEILNSQGQIDKVEITLAPAWQKNFPLFASKINVSIGQTVAQ